MPHTFAPRLWCNKGNIANGVTFVIMVIGIIWVLLADRECPVFPWKAGKIRTHAPLLADFAARYVLSLGLFGWAGAVTNWLAVHMLFEKVPGIVSGL